MQAEQLADLAIFIERFVKTNYFRDIEKWKISAFQDRLRSYELSDVKRAFEKHLSNPKKGEYMPTPQNIVAEIGFREKQSGEMGNCCFEISNGTKCGNFGYSRIGKKGQQEFYYCKRHFETCTPMWARNDVEIAHLLLELKILPDEGKEKSKAENISFAAWVTREAERMRKESLEREEKTLEDNPIFRKLEYVRYVMAPPPEKPLAGVIGWASHGKVK